MENVVLTHDDCTNAGEQHDEKRKKMVAIIEEIGQEEGDGGEKVERHREKKNGEEEGGKQMCGSLNLAHLISTTHFKFNVYYLFLSFSHINIILT